MRRWSVFWIVILTGCSAAEGGQRERFIPARPVTGIMYDTVTGTVEGAWIAVQTPIEDLNLKQKPIPDKLQQIANNPYALPYPLLCNGIHREIIELDALLGPDVCTPQNPTGTPPPDRLPWQAAIDTCTSDNPTGTSRKGEYVERGASMARDRAVDIVGSKTNIIPFRSVVRHFSGAEKHNKEVDRAYQAGKLRRAFLKGLAATFGPNCLSPEMIPQLLPAEVK